MDEKINVNVIEKPSVQSLSDAEFDTLCMALFFEIEKIIKSENR